MTTGHRDGGAAPRRLTIGKVLTELEPEFPEVSSSKIRFLEAEGLVTPVRTASGYRTYGVGDVARLRYILRAQRDRFWPLKVIREALEAIDRGLPDPMDGATGDLAQRPDPVSDTPGPAELLRRRTRSLTGPQLRAEGGIDKSTFTALEAFGLISADPSGHYSAEALSVVVAARRLAEYGLEPRHLRPFRTAADREVGLVEQVVAARRGDGPPDRRAAEVASGCLALHVALVRAGLVAQSNGS